MGLSSVHRPDGYKKFESGSGSNTASPECVQKTEQDYCVRETSVSDDLKALADTEQHEIQSYAECRLHEVCKKLENTYTPFLSALTHLFPDRKGI